MHARGIPQSELDGLSVEPDFGDIVFKDGRFIVARELSHRKDAEERRFPARAVADDDEFAPERAALYLCLPIRWYVDFGFRSGMVCNRSRPQRFGFES